MELFALLVVAKEMKGNHAVTLFFFFSYKMVIADSDYNGPLFKVSQVFLCNDRVDLKTAPASDTGVSAGSHLKGAGVNYCGTEYDESLIDSECLEVSPIVGKNTDCDTIYSDDGAATCHPHAIESELLPVSSEGIECDRNDVSNNYAEHGDWMVAWDTFYERTYFYNI
ncbi:hypothetical protein JHK82_048738 [Glycine max]|nr:hypothetical protein JHK85_049238 [Glycine max]KAG5098884.1 hypothetical protein JHK82_048738 [Glycine max]